MKKFSFILSFIAFLIQLVKLIKSSYKKDLYAEIKHGVIAILLYLTMLFVSVVGL